jgi:hypothetical protein
MVTNKNTTTKVSIKQSLVQRLGSMLISLKLVFSQWAYSALAGTMAAIFWVVFNVFEQLLFFSPIVIFYLPEDAITGFILSNIMAILLGLVVSMNIYVLKHSRGIKLNAASFFSGSSLGLLSSTCASCSSLGFLLVSILGGAGMTLSTFLSNYQTPLRIVSVALLLWAYYSVSVRLTMACNIKPSRAENDGQIYR